MVTIHKTLRGVNQLLVVDETKCAVYTLRRIKKLRALLLLLLLLASFVQKVQTLKNN